VFREKFKPTKCVSVAQMQAQYEQELSLERDFLAVIQQKQKNI
jgi:hypothetical protein